MTDELSFKDNGWATQVDTQVSSPIVSVTREGTKLLSVELYFNFMSANERRWQIKSLPFPGNGIEIRPLNDDATEIGDSLHIRRQGMHIDGTLYRHSSLIPREEATNSQLLAELISRIKKGLLTTKDVLCSLGSAL